MPSLSVRRFIATTLGAALVMGASGAALATDEPDPALIAPPSLELALATLLPGSTPLAGEAESLELAKLPLPACEIADIPTRYGKVRHWKMTLLDTNLKLKRSYKPWDLVSVSRANIKGSGKVRKLMIDDLKALARAARKAGKPLAVRSAYRSYDYQKSLFDYYLRTSGYEKAVKYSARPGHSEHQLGTTIDFTTAPSVPLKTTFGQSPSGKWLAKNGWRYGFIMSYPRGKRSASCYGHEPWHWRYFGRDLAREIHESGQVPRRYLYENFETAP